jgi:hypothetical protein
MQTQGSPGKVDRTKRAGGTNDPPYFKCIIVSLEFETVICLSNSIRTPNRICCTLPIPFLSNLSLQIQCLQRYTLYKQGPLGKQHPKYVR